MKKKTTFLEDYNNFVDTATKQNTSYFKIFIVLFVIICLLLICRLFNYPSKEY